MNENEITCDAGHVHKNARSADDCESRRRARARLLEARRVGRINPIAAEEAEHGGSYYVNRRGKAWMGR